MAQNEPIERPAPAEDIWTKCPACREISFRKEVERNLNVCPKCGYHHRLSVAQRLAITADRGSWREMFTELAGGDPLKFVDTRPYPERLAAVSRHEKDAVHFTRLRASCPWWCSAHRAARACRRARSR